MAEKTYAYKLDTSYTPDGNSTVHFYLCRRSEGKPPRPAFWEKRISIESPAPGELERRLAEAATEAFNFPVTASEIELYVGGQNGVWRHIDEHGIGIDPKAKINGVELTSNDLWVLEWALHAALMWEPEFAPDEPDTEHRINQELTRRLRKKLDAIL